MLVPEKHIFRSIAIKRYLQSREKDVFPRIVPPRFFFFMWILFCLLLAMGVVAWKAEVPTYVTGPAIIPAPSHQLAQENNMSIALVFLPTNQRDKLKLGQQVVLQINGTNVFFSSTIEMIDPSISSPGEIRKHYALDGNAVILVRQPSIVIKVRLRSHLSTNTYEGSTLTASVQVGTQNLLSLFLGRDG